VNGLDIFTIIVIVAFTGLGFYYGLIKSVSSLVAVIGGLLLAKKFSANVTDFLSVLQVADVRGVLGFIVVFFFFFILIKVFLHVLQKILNASILSPLDNAFGGAFGFIKGLLIALMVMAILQVIMPKDSAIIVHSRILPYSTKAIVLVKGFVPENMQPYIQMTTQKVNKQSTK
jgi:uncharacterized membrane protein required for colicin V production